MENSSVIDYLQSTLSTATDYHTEALAHVQVSRDAYKGEYYGNETSGRSKIVVKDIMRTVQGALPSITEPFLADEIVQIDADMPGMVQQCAKQEALMNYQWSKKNDPLEIMETYGMNLMVEGTAWFMTGWHRDGYPTVETVPFESVIPDPAATSMDDCRFIIYRRKVTVGEILGNPEWYGKHTKADLQVLMPGNSTQYEPDPTRGREESYNPDDRSLEHIEVFEYYGYYDLNQDDEAEPVLMIWSESKLLRATESPFPFGPIPFDVATYSKIPFSVYGATIEDMIGDHQRLRTSITRGIIDNMANSNNGTKFIRKGSLDAVNMNRLKRGDPIVELNAPSQMHADALIYDGSFNPLPADVYHMMEGIQQEEQDLTGISNLSIGSFDPRSINQTATGSSIMASMSQKRLMFTVRHISSALKGVFSKWASLNADLLTEASITTPRGEQIEVIGAELPVDGFGISIKTPTQGLKEKKLMDLGTMLQQVAPMSNVLGLDPAMHIITQMAKELEMPTLQKSILESYIQMKQRPQQDPMQEIEAMEKQAEIVKDLAQTEKYKAETDAKRVETMRAYNGLENIG